MSSPSLLRSLTLALIAIAALFFIDASLATVERSQSREDAERAYKAGVRLMREGQNAAAAEQFGNALANARDNEAYRLALGRALSASGRFSEAEQTLGDLLERNGQSGPANLAMARVLVKENRLDDAFSFYHRAIYGQWNHDNPDSRLQVRFELADLIAAQSKRDGLLAELLPLQAEAPDDAATSMKLGKLFVSAGAPVRAAALFRDVLHREPRNADAWDNLGDIEFVRGNYRLATGDFENALRYRPDDEHARERAEVSKQILAMDPTPRGLGTAEQLRRSLQLVDVTANAVRACVPADLLAESDKALKNRHSDFDSNLELAVKLWQAGKACNNAAPEALALTLGKLAQ